MAKKKKNNLTELSFDEIFIILEMVNKCNEKSQSECYETINDIKRFFEVAIMNKFIEFCIKNEIKFGISDVEHCNSETYKVDGKEIEITLYKYHNVVKQYVKLTDLTDEGLKFEDVCLCFAKDFNDFCEKVGE